MSDITKCHGEGCVLRNTCHRFTAPDGYWQSYFTETPLKENGCEYYWRNDEVSGGKLSSQADLFEVHSPTNPD